MSWQFSPVALLYAVTACVALGVAVTAWRLRPARGVAVFTLMVLCTVFWALGDVLEIAGPSLMWKVLGLRVSYLGVVGTIFFWNIFVLIYTRHEEWVTPISVGLLSVVPALSFLAVLTVPDFDLFYISYGLLDVNGRLYVERAYGPFFWIWALYGYSSVILGSLFLVRRVIRVPNLYRGQAGLLIVSAITPLASNGFYLAGYNPLAPYDPSSIAFALAAVGMILALRRFHFLETAPVTHDLVFKNVQGGVIILDASGRITEINPAAERILRRDQNDVVGTMLFTAFPEYQSVLQDYEHVDEIKTEIQLRDRFFELQITPFVNEAGTQTGRIIMLYDITDQRRLIDDLNAYAHTVAHDLKNPLSLITGFASVIEASDDAAIAANARKYVPIIRRTGIKMVAIIDELLLLASVRDTESVAVKPLNMSRIVNRVIDRCSDDIERSKADVSVPEQWPDALGHAPWVEAIWVNYLTNALKYGGAPPRITLGAESQSDGTIRFWVRDQGPGLTPAERERLFVPFTRLEKHAGIEGHGLGLSIVHRIAEKLSGTAGVESALGKGSTFYFILPEVGKPVAAAQQTADDRQSGPALLRQGSVSQCV